MKNIFILLLLASQIGAFAQSVTVSDCTPSPWELNLHLAPLSSSLTSDQFSSEENRKPGFSGGLDLAYFFRNTTRLKMSVSLGADFAYYVANRNLNFNDSVWTYDYVNDKVHIFENGNVSETQKVVYLNLPLKLRLEYELSPKWSAYFNAGVYYAISLSKTYQSDAVLTRKGYYPSTNCVVFDVDVPETHFFYPTNKALTTTSDLQTQNAMGTELNLGLKYKINQRFSIFAGAKWLNGIGSISNYTAKPAYTYADNIQNMNSLMGRADKITANAIGVQFGLSIRLGKCTPKPVVEKTEITNLKTGKDSSQTPSTIVAQTDSLRKNEMKNVPVVAIENQTVSRENMKLENDSVKVVAKLNENKANDLHLSEAPKTINTLQELNQLLDKKQEKVQNFVLKNIEFETNTSDLTSESKSNLDVLVEALRSHPNIKLKISGNTDKVGKTESNKALSLKRAEAALEYIASKGTDKSRMTATGNGAEKPIDTNDTPEGRHKNRRVEFEIVTQ